MKAIQHSLIATRRDTQEALHDSAAMTRPEIHLLKLERQRRPHASDTLILS